MASTAITSPPQQQPQRFALTKIDELSSEYCGHCMRKPNDGKLLHCTQCRAACYCSVDCQRAAWKAAHKHTCEALKKGSTRPIVDFEGIREALPSGALHDASTATVRAHALDAAARRKLCCDFWSNPARLLFPSLEDEPWTDIELPQPRPGAILRCLDTMRLLQATCAAACHDLQDSLPDSSIAAATAYQVNVECQQMLFAGPFDDLPKQISLMWQTAILWTVALSRLIVIENADPNGERAARLRINRARALDCAQHSLASGDVGFAGNDARGVFAFWWPFRERTQPGGQDVGMQDLGDRGRWDLCMALFLAALADARRAAQSVRATPETRALAYVLFASLDHHNIEKGDAVNRALALLKTGEDRCLSQAAAEERQRRRSVVREAAKGVHDEPVETKLGFLVIAEPFHIADSDDAQMGGGHCDRGSDGNLNHFPCEPANGCTICQWRREIEREGGAES